MLCRRIISRAARTRLMWNNHHHQQQHLRAFASASPTLLNTNNNNNNNTASKALNPEVEKNRSYSAKEGFVWKSGYEPISVPEMTVDEYVWKNVAKWEDKIAIVTINECGF